MSNDNEQRDNVLCKKRGRPSDGSDQCVIADNLKRMCLAAPSESENEKQEQRTATATQPSPFFRKPKYQRKVDFLIDELIKKSRKKYEYDWAPATSTSSEYTGMELCIPGAVGPSPFTDNRLYRRPLEHKPVDVSQEDECTAYDKYSGNVSHSEWFRNTSVMDDRCCVDMMSEESVDSCATNRSQRTADDSSSDCEYDDIFLY